MSLTKVLSRPLFLISSVVVIAAVVAIALHPTDGLWWAVLVASLSVAALEFPFRATARVRGSITVDRPIEDVYQFLSQPSNRHLWNPQVGPTQPGDVPVEVGKAWTFAPTNRIQKLGRWCHSFSKLVPPNLIEITATTGHGLHLTYRYVLRDLGGRTEVAFVGAVPGMAAPVAWLSAAVFMRLYPNRDRARLKQALELKPSSG